MSPAATPARAWFATPGNPQRFLPTGAGSSSRSIFLSEPHYSVDPDQLGYRSGQSIDRHGLAHPLERRFAPGRVVRHDDFRDGRGLINFLGDANFVAIGEIL